MTLNCAHRSRGLYHLEADEVPICSRIFHSFFISTANALYWLCYFECNKRFVLFTNIYFISVAYSDVSKHSDDGGHSWKKINGTNNDDGTLQA